MNWPNPPDGTSLTVQFLRRLLFACRASQLISSPGNYLLERTSNGTLIKFQAGGGSSAPVSVQVKALHFKKSLGDYFLTNEGTSVAKGYKLRNSITSETIYGSVVNFTYPHNLANDALAYIYRVATVTNAGSENQGIVPQFLVNDLIYAVQFTTGVVSIAADTSQPTGTAVGYLDLNVDGRAWSRFSNQNF